MPLRLRLFDDVSSGFGHDCETSPAELEAVLTPRGPGNNAFCWGDNHGQDTPLSIEIPAKPFMRHRDAFDVRRSLFYGKRSADEDLMEETPKHSVKRAKDASGITQKSNERLNIGIINAVETLEIGNDMIADGSGEYTLPTIPGKHKDLMAISPDVMADVVHGCFNDVIGDVTIVDCRYPYEFEGGHIRGAVNMYTKDEVNSLLQKPVADGKRHVLIFHCEFSSERGPKMYRFLRAQDRMLNSDIYPRLNFPEVYLLHGGYKAFFNKYRDLCDPISYKPMLHENHAADLRHFRVKSKSWTGEDGKQTTSRRHRSRLGRHLSF
ncbi:M-phase inducer phosphatase 1-like [Mya arenaria]|uniref:M-phase inducer phosphatase 1-like n=1 Tax=Mya arenaria TaxID=6604 RepID=UPI0022DFEE2F|nr:M-phase inducer phosphatase 1-like [Mya arenaria]